MIGWVAASVLSTALVTGCAPNRPCLRGHDQTTYVMQCFGYDKNGFCTVNIPVPQTSWVCDAEGTPYPHRRPQAMISPADITTFTVKAPSLGAALAIVEDEQDRGRRAWVTSRRVPFMIHIEQTLLSMTSVAWRFFHEVTCHGDRRA